MSSLFLYYGINVVNCGICSTPCIAFLSDKYSLSFMITASHNEYSDNGIKIFNSNKEKISIDVIKEIEFDMFLKHEDFYSDNFGRLHFKPTLVFDYLDNLSNKVKPFKFKGKVLIDCANGGVFNIVSVLKNYCHNLIVLNNEPSGKNINDNCGVIHIDKFKEYSKYDITAFLDGDGDRLGLIDNKGRILDGDDICYLLTEHVDNYKEINKVVITEASNIKLYEHFQLKDIQPLLSEPGDSKIAQLMDENDCLLGIEPSGHILIKDYLKCSDGIYVLLLILKMLNDTNKSLSELISPFHKANKLVKEIKLKNREVVNNNTIAILKNDIGAMFDEPVSFYVRKSGTENIVRVIVQSNSEKNNFIAAQFIEEYLIKLSEGDNI